jgi:ribonuclease VapC
MVVDTSAVLTILFGEPEAATYAQSIESDPAPLISAASVFEAGIVLLRRHGPEALSDLQDLIKQGGLQIEPVTVEQAELALDAYQRFGKGRHSASLNFGDCFTYALAKAMRQPLLFKGNDFSQTDLTAVLQIYDEDEQT